MTKKEKCKTEWVPVFLIGFKLSSSSSCLLKICLNWKAQTGARQQLFIPLSNSHSNYKQSLSIISLI